MPEELLRDEGLQAREEALQKARDSTTVHYEYDEEEVLSHIPETATMKRGSKAGLFSSWDVKRVINGALMMGCGAGLILTLSESNTVDFGVFQPIAVAAAGVVIDVIKNWLTDTTEEQ